MANELCTRLGLIGADLSGKLVLVVEEHGSSASFVVGSLLWNAVRSEASVCLLALHHTREHYLNMTKKLGFNLKAAIENKTAIILEPFNLSGGKTSKFNELDMKDEENVKRLIFDVKEALNTLSGKKYLIIDDLSALISLGATSALVVEFVQCCRSLQGVDQSLGLVVSTHCTEDGEHLRLVANFVAHLADCRVTVSGLRTGFSSNVTGNIQVVGTVGDDPDKNPEVRFYHFKLTDRQIKVFAPGSVGIHS